MTTRRKRAYTYSTGALGGENLTLPTAAEKWDGLWDRLVRVIGAITSGKVLCIFRRCSVKEKVTTIFCYRLKMLHGLSIEQNHDNTCLEV